MQGTMKTLMVLAAAVLSAEALSSQLQLKRSRADQVKNIQGSVAYAVDPDGYESKNTKQAIDDAAKTWLKSMRQSRAKIPSISSNMLKAKRDFEHKQRDRKARYSSLGVRDLFQEKVDEFAQKRKEVANKDAKTSAKALAEAWSDKFMAKNEVRHLTYSTHLKLMKERDDDTEIRVEIPIAEDEKHTGLMFQTMMPEDAGMLFVYNKPAQQVLYMRNTHIPLDVGWFDADGVLREITEMQPHDETYRYSQGHANFGMEMNKGFWAKNGMVEGQTRLDVEQVCDALSIKGQNNYDLCPSHRAMKGF